MKICKKCLHGVVCLASDDSTLVCTHFKDSSRYIELPCKVGDTVYTNFAMQGWYFRDKCRPYSAKVVFMGLNNSKEMGGGIINVLYNKGENMLQFRFSDIGKTVFLTKEEAEKALKGRSEGDES